MRGVTKADLIDKVAEKSGLTKKDAGQAVDALFDAVAEALAAGDRVQIVGFGTFEVRERAARHGRNPQTGQEISIEARKVPAFKAGRRSKTQSLGNDIPPFSSLTAGIDGATHRFAHGGAFSRFCQCAIFQVIYRFVPSSFPDVVGGNRFVTRPIRIGLLGCGTVGSGVASILHENAERITRRAGGDVIIQRVAVRDVRKARHAAIRPELLTTDVWSVVHDPDVDIVVELIGGVEPARSLMAAALEQGKSVVTANKAALAHHGAELAALAAENGADLLFEGSVAGGIPIIKPLRDCLAANRIQAVTGIINGTTNYILTGMARDGLDFHTMMQRAQEAGYAEADPTSDVEGYDAAFKLAILASIAFETPVRVEDVYCEGISRISPVDIEYGKELGYTVKLLAVAKEDDGRLELRVHPAFIPADHRWPRSMTCSTQFSSKAMRSGS